MKSVTQVETSDPSRRKINGPMVPKLPLASWAPLSNNLLIFVQGAPRGKHESAIASISSRLSQDPCVTRCSSSQLVGHLLAVHAGTAISSRCSSNKPLVVGEIIFSYRRKRDRSWWRVSADVCFLEWFLTVHYQYLQISNSMCLCGTQPRPSPPLEHAGLGIGGITD